MFNKINFRILAYYLVSTFFIFYVLNYVISKTEKLAAIEEYDIEIRFFQTENILNESTLLKKILYEISKNRIYNVTRIDGFFNLETKKKTSGNLNKDKISYNNAINEANKIVKTIEKKYVDELILKKQSIISANVDESLINKNLMEIEYKTGCDKILVLDGSHEYFIAENKNLKSKNDHTIAVSPNSIKVCNTISELKSIEKILNKGLVNEVLFSAIIKDSFIQKDKKNFLFPNTNFKYIILLIISLITSQIILIFCLGLIKNFSKIK